MHKIQWAMAVLLLCSMTGCGQPQESLATPSDSVTRPPTKEEARTDALVSKLKREAEVRRQSARSQSAYSLLMTIRSQLELYQVQHNDQYPDLVEQQWEQVANKTGVDGIVDEDGERGPYFRDPPANPFTESSRVAADTTSDWQYNPVTGEIRIVVSSDLAAMLGPQLKHGRDFVVGTGDAAGVRYQLEQELGDIERALARQKVTDDEVKTIKRELPQIEKTLAEMTAKFRPLDRLDKAVEEMTLSAAKAGLTVEIITPLKPALSPLLVAQPMLIKVMGSLAEVSKWATQIDDGFSQRLDVFQVIDNGQTVVFHVSLAAFYLPNIVTGAEHRSATSSSSPQKLAARLKELESLLARAKADGLISPPEHQAAAARLRSAVAQQNESNNYELKQRFTIRKKALTAMINLVKSIDSIDRPTAALRRLIDALPAAVKLTDVRMVREKGRSRIKIDAAGLAPDLNTVTLAVNKLNRSRNFQGMQLLGVNRVPKEGAPTDPRTAFRLRGTSLASE